MPHATDTDGILRQNLVDAGCGSEIVQQSGSKMVQQCMALARKQDQPELIRVLSRHRRTLLDALHQSEKQIDCLDYLIYTLEKQRQ